MLIHHLHYFHPPITPPSSTTIHQETRETQKPKRKRQIGGAHSNSPLSSTQERTKSPLIILSRDLINPSLPQASSSTFLVFFFATSTRDQPCPLEPPPSTTIFFPTSVMLFSSLPGISYIRATTNAENLTHRPAPTITSSADHLQLTWRFNSNHLDLRTTFQIQCDRHFSSSI